MTDIYFFYKFCNEIGTPWLFWITICVSTTLTVLIVGLSVYKLFRGDKK